LIEFIRTESGGEHRITLLGVTPTETSVAPFYTLRNNRSVTLVFGEYNVCEGVKIKLVVRGLKPYFEMTVTEGVVIDIYEIHEQRSTPNSVIFNGVHRIDGHSASVVFDVANECGVLVTDKLEHLIKSINLDIKSEIDKDGVEIAFLYRELKLGLH